MLTIQVMTSLGTHTYFADSPFDKLIRLRPCFFCQEQLIELPSKFCCDQHRALYHYYRIGKPPLSQCASKTPVLLAPTLQ